jgi:F0F1-type ATP synthase delta subunit
MKIKSKIYAQALVELMLGNKTSEEETEIADKFLKLLEKNSDLRRVKEIISLAEDLFIKKTGRRKIILETARRVPEKEIIEKISQTGDIVKKKINKDLIAGIKIIINDEQLDMSMKNKLNKLFK